MLQSSNSVCEPLLRMRPQRGCTGIPSAVILYAKQKGKSHVTPELHASPRRFVRRRLPAGAVRGDAGFRPGRSRAGDHGGRPERRRHRDQARDLAARRALLDQRPDRGGHPALGRNTIEDLSRNVAGLTIQNLGPGQSQVSVRGVSAGQIVRDQPGVKEQVGVYLDESVISLSLFTPDIDLFDLNRVETLRGPQGTLFGSGSVGGTHPLHHQPARARRVRRLGRGQSQPARRRRFRRPSQGHGQRPARRRRRLCARSAITPNMAASSTRCGAGGESTRTSTTATAPAAASRSRSSRRRHPRSRRASSTRRSAPTASTGRRSTTSTPTRSRRRGRRSPSTSASSSCCSARAFEDNTLLADLTASVDLGDDRR